MWTRWEWIRCVWIACELLHITQPTTPHASTLFRRYTGFIYLFIFKCTSSVLFLIFLSIHYCFNFQFCFVLLISSLNFKFRFYLFVYRLFSILLHFNSNFILILSFNLFHSYFVSVSILFRHPFQFISIVCVITLKCTWVCLLYTSFEPYLFYACLFECYTLIHVSDRCILLWFATWLLLFSPWCTYIDCHLFPRHLSQS